MFKTAEVSCPMEKKTNISYRKLWHILIDKGMKKKDLAKAANLTHYQMTKLLQEKLKEYISLTETIDTGEI